MLERRLVTRWTPLHVALCKGNLECAEKLIHSSGLPRAMSRAIETDEMVVAQAQQLCVSQPWLAYIMESEIDDLTPRIDPLPLLHVAAANFESVEALEQVYDMLERAGCLEGLGIDHLDSFGDTAFAISAFSDQFAFLPRVHTWFLQRGADINFTLRDPERRFRSVFNALCDRGLYRNALLLIDLGVDIHKDANIQPNNRRESALILCCGYGVGNLTSRSREDLDRPQALELIKRLIHAGVDVNAKTEVGTTALISAAETHFVDAVRELLVAKADVGAEDEDGLSALHWAVRGVMTLPRVTREAVNTISLLLKHGADPNQRSRAVDVGSPLFSDISSCDGDLLEVRPACWDLRGSNADIPKPTFYDVYPKRSSMVPLASLLIGCGADPNIFLEDPRDLGQGSLYDQLLRLRGRSLIAAAVFTGQSDSVDTLLRLGALVTFQDYVLMMRSLIDRAVRPAVNKTNVVESLTRILKSDSLRLKEPHDRNSIMNIWTELLHYAVASRPKLVPALAPHVVLTEKRGPGGKTVLHLLAQWTRKRRETKHAFDHRVSEVMFGLLRCEAGQLVDQPDNGGQLPLHVAIKRGNYYFAKPLLQFGASIHIGHKNADGLEASSSPSSSFKEFATLSHFEEAIKMLESHGSRFRLEGLDRRSAELAEEVEYEKRRNSEDKAPDGSIPKVRMTTRLVRHIIHLGADVDESEENGRAALRLFSRLLLCLPDEGPAESGSLKHNNSSRARRSSANNSVGLVAPEDSDSNFVSVLGELDMDVNSHDTSYNSDSDYEKYASGNHDDAELDEGTDLDSD